VKKFTVRGIASVIIVTNVRAGIVSPAIILKNCMKNAGASHWR